VDVVFVWVFQGNLGEGKTSAMSILAHYYKMKAARAGVNIKLFANYGLTGAHPLTHYSDFYQVARSEGSICLLDAAQTSLDSRLFQKGANISFTQFLFYMRKLRSSLFLASPSIRNLDSRIRALCNVLVVCHRLPTGFQYEIYDYQAERLLRRKFLPKRKAEEIFGVGLYDTNQIIRSIPFPSSEREFDKFLDKLIEINDQTRASSSRKSILPAVGMGPHLIDEEVGDHVELGH
jgi:hypothetical protein